MKKIKFSATQRAWAFYDWANSVYSLVIATAVFPIYYDAVTRTETSDQIQIFGTTFTNSVLYTYTLALSFFIVSLISPYLSALADITGKKKRFMQFFVLLGSVGCSLLFFFEGVQTVWVGLLGALMAGVGFNGSLVFYNAFLPEIAPPEKQDRLSAFGFGLGYFGSSLLLIFNLAMISSPQTFGLSDTGQASRITFLTVGLWWFGFSLITFRFLPDNLHGQKAPKGWSKKAYTELVQVWREFNALPRLRRFIGSFFLFSMGVQTVILLAALFGQKVLGLEASDLITTILLIQFVAIAGAYLFSRISEKFGNIKAIGTALVIWIGVCFSAYFIESRTEFFILGSGVGLVMGGIQAIARSTYSKMLPKTTDNATYFSFYDVSEKIAAMLGMFTIGLIESATGDLRNAVLLLSLFFVVSFVFLITIPKTKYVY